jgi:hypothetical protein
MKRELFRYGIKPQKCKFSTKIRNKNLVLDIFYFYFLLFYFIFCDLLLLLFQDSIWPGN